MTTIGEFMGTTVRRPVTAVREYPDRPHQTEIEFGNGAWLLVTRSEWPLDWPPRLGDVVTVAVPRVVAAYRPDPA